jgi:hypothetical protein
MFIIFSPGQNLIVRDIAAPVQKQQDAAPSAPEMNRETAQSHR